MRTAQAGVILYSSYSTKWRFWIKEDTGLWAFSIDFHSTSSYFYHMEKLWAFSYELRLTSIFKQKWKPTLSARINNFLMHILIVQSKVTSQDLHEEHSQYIFHFCLKDQVNKTPTRGWHPHNDQLCISYYDMKQQKYCRVRNDHSWPSSLSQLHGVYWSLLMENAVPCLQWLY